MPATPRTAESCPHRRPFADQTGDGRHYCGLALDLIGKVSPALCTVRPDECDVCCRYDTPAATAPNPLVASVLYKAAMRIEQTGGTQGCDASKAREVMSFAGQFLLVLSRRGGGVRGRVAPSAVRRGPCLHLGAQIGERPCKSCRGNVRLKVFHCDHPRHATTTLRDCASCQDHEEGSRHHHVQHWAIAMLAGCSLRTATLRDSIRSLRRSGWNGRLHVFSDSGFRARLASVGLGHVRIIPRISPGPAGCASLLLALAELHMREAGADAYLLAPADARFLPGLRHHLQQHLWPSTDTGAVVHCAGISSGSGTGFTQDDRHPEHYQNGVLILPRDHVRAFLADSKVVTRCLEDPFQSEECSPVRLLKDWCQRTRRVFWLHYFDPPAARTTTGGEAFDGQNHP